MALKRSGLAIGVALAMVGPLVLASTVALVVGAKSPLDAASEPEPLIGVVESAERSGQVNASIKVEFAEATSPVTQASGTVTALDVVPGTQVTSGMRVMAVNAQDVIAYTAASPLYRDIYDGLSGADVTTTQELLVAWGYGPITTDGKVGPQTLRAIKAFNVAHGYGKDNAVLSLASLLWVGAAAPTISTVEVDLGDSVTPGTAVFTTGAGAAAIVVTEPVGTAFSGPVHLLVGDAVTDYTVGSARVTDPQAVAAIVAALGTATEGLGTLQLRDAVTVATVPSGAVVTDAQGKTCIFASPTSAPTLVSPTGGSLGTVDLDPTLAGTPLLLNPREVREDLACG